MNFRLNAVIAFGQSAGTRRRCDQPRPCEGPVFHFLLHLLDFIKNGKALGKHGATRERESVLRQITDQHPALPVNRAIIQAFGSGQNFQQRGFTRAVPAHQPDASLGVINQSKSSKRTLGPKRLPACESWITASI